MWCGFCKLPLPSRRQAKKALSPVSSLFDANQALLPHSVQSPRQRRAVHCEAFAQPFLIHLTGCSQRREKSEMCNLEACLLQFLVINPRYDPGCAPKGLASTRQVKERFGGGWFECPSSHNICIYIHSNMGRQAAACSDSRSPIVSKQFSLILSIAYLQNLH